MYISFRQWIESKENLVKWNKPSIEQEKEEIIRQAKESNIDVDLLMNAVNKGSLVDLENEMWKNMENTDSNDEDLTLEKIKSWTDKDVGGITKALNYGGDLTAPIVLLHNNVPICVSGNTRLSICKVFGITPKVWLSKM